MYATLRLDSIRASSFDVTNRLNQLASKKRRRFWREIEDKGVVSAGSDAMTIVEDLTWVLR